MTTKILSLLIIDSKRNEKKKEKNGKCQEGHIFRLYL